MNIKDFIKFEFIGLDVEILECKLNSLKGLYGKIIDETKNTFVIEYEGKRKIIPKAVSKFLFYYKDYWIVIDGKLLLDRPWDRIKIKIKKKI